MPKTAMAQVTAKYKAKTPQPLNTQFKDRLPKADAVKHHEKRKLKETVLYPQGKAYMHILPRKLGTNITFT